MQSTANCSRAQALLKAASALAAACGAATIPQGALGQGAPADLTAPTGSVHDFDYHIGRWTAVQRRLKKRWTSNPQWEVFPSTTVYSQYLGGTVNTDETDFPTKGWAGVTVRAFDLKRRQWFVYWISSRDGVLQAPVVGGYRGLVGTFVGDDTDNGIPIKVRIVRTKEPPDKERWQQAFSRDGGKTWETNWIADFTRSRG